MHNSKIRFILTFRAGNAHRIFKVAASTEKAAKSEGFKKARAEFPNTSVQLIGCKS